MIEERFSLLEGYDRLGNKYAIEGISHYHIGKPMVNALKSSLSKGLVLLPSYALVHARGNAKRSDLVWDNHWDVTCSEHLRLRDKRGTLGRKNQVYVVDIQNGGMFVNNLERMDSAFAKPKLIQARNASFGQDEVDRFLDMIAREDTDGLREMGVHFNTDLAYIFKNFGDFRDASDSPSFLDYFPMYIVVRRDEEAKSDLHGQHGIYLQRDNPILAIVSGGFKPLEKMLYQVGGGGNYFSSTFNAYREINGGKIVTLGSGRLGLGAGHLFDRCDRIGGVSREGLDLLKRLRYQAPTPEEIAEFRERMPGAVALFGDEQEGELSLASDKQPEKKGNLLDRIKGWFS